MLKPERTTSLRRTTAGSAGPPAVRRDNPQYSPRHIAYALRLAAAGRPVAYVCRQVGVSRTVFYVWRKKYPLASMAD